jgi:hypothetical protein
VAEDRRGTSVALIGGSGGRHDVFDASPVGRVLFIAWLFLPAAVLLLGMALLEGRRQVRVRRFWCDTAGQVVRVVFVDGTVRACSAFEPARAVTCDRECLDTGRRPPRHAAA